jgi:hypothetical protein
MPIGPKNFNREFIKLQKIKKIQVHIINKADGAIIHDNGIEHTYYFDQNGYIIHYYFTVENKEQRAYIIQQSARYDGKSHTTTLDYKLSNDTVRASFFYDHLNRMSYKRVKTGSVYDGYYYEYNDNNQLLKTSHFRETNIHPNSALFELGEKTLVSVETNVYNNFTATQTNITTAINNNPPYQKTITNHSATKLLLSKDIDLTSNAKRTEYLYEYNAMKRLVKETTKIYTNGLKTLVNEFVYATTGNVLSEKKYVNNNLAVEINYLFDKLTGLVKSEVNRDHEHASIQIVKYEYTFY